jgi:iron complex transport system permease protein
MNGTGEMQLQTGEATSGELTVVDEAVTGRLQRARWRAMILWTPALIASLGLVMLAASTLGAARIPVATTAGVLLETVGVATSWAGDATETQRQIIRAIRLPRILTAAIVGAALALVGAVMQSIFRNPMADPGIVGVSAGGALGALLAIASGFASAQVLVLPGTAFIGSLAAALAVFLFSLRRGRNQIATLLLAGIAVTYLCSAATTALISLTYNRDTLREMVFWLLGGFDNRGWEHVLLVAPPVALGTLVFLAHGRALNLLVLGEEDAQSLGLRVQRTRLVLLVAAALVTSAAVAVSGLIGFVGLIVPHAIRLLVGSSDHRLTLPLGALGGACFLVAADTIARVALQPAELRVGVVTALIGSPCFLWLLAHSRREVRQA